MDLIRCNRLVYACSIGIHDHEKNIRQDLVIDVEARVVSIPADRADDPRVIRLNYFRADELLEKMLSARHFNLIETVAEEVARLILAAFDVASVRVSVTKKPLGMPRLGSVTYECERVKAA